MAKKIIKFFKRFFSHRLSVLLIVFLLMSSFLLVRLFQLQIVQGEEYSENFTIMTTRERRLKSTRGNIYDRNGNLIAYNELSNSVTFEDSGRYSSTRGTESFPEQRDLPAYQPDRELRGYNNQ